MKSARLFYRLDNAAARLWANRIKQHLASKYPKVKLGASRPEVVIVLGGDGTILEAARKYQASNSLILGLNLGRVGFLAAVQAEEDFIPGIDQVLGGSYQIVERMMIEANVKRAGKAIFKAISLNDVAVKSPLAMVDLQVAIDRRPYQYVHGSGVLVATATGSTAYNLSAHGPIVMPHIQCMIVSELLDHNLPTPSLVVDPGRTITVEVLDFRTQGTLRLKAQPADVVVSADGNQVFPLRIGDRIVVKKSAKHSRFAQVDPDAFLKGLQDKFAFK